VGQRRTVAALASCKALVVRERIQITGAVERAHSVAVKAERVGLPTGSLQPVKYERMWSLAPGCVRGWMVGNTLPVPNVRVVLPLAVTALQGLPSSCLVMCSRDRGCSLVRLTSYARRM